MQKGQHWMDIYIYGNETIEEAILNWLKWPRLGHIYIYMAISFCALVIILLTKLIVLKKCILDPIFTKSNIFQYFITICTSHLVAICSKTLLVTARNSRYTYIIAPSTIIDVNKLVQRLFWTQ